MRIRGVFSGNYHLARQNFSTLKSNFSFGPVPFDDTVVVDPCVLDGLFSVTVVAETTIGPGQVQSLGGNAVVPIPTLAVCSLDLVKTFTPVPPPGECKGGITELTLVYTGAICGGGDNPQLDKKDNPKFACSDNPANTSPGAMDVDIVITKDADLADVSPDTGIMIGDEVLFTPSAANDKGKLKADTKFDVIGPGGTQSLSIHTSCSKSIAPGDKFGSFVVDSFTSKDGGFVGGPVVAGDTEFTYKV